MEIKDIAYWTKNMWTWDESKLSTWGRTHGLPNTGLIPNPLSYRETRREPGHILGSYDKCPAHCYVQSVVYGKREIFFSCLVNYTTCQLQKIQAALRRRSFSPGCNPDGSFREIQCTTTTSMKCWKVDPHGKKIQDIDATIKFSSERHQPLASKEKTISIRQFPELEEDEIGNLCSLFRWFINYPIFTCTNGNRYLK